MASLPFSHKIIAILNLILTLTIATAIPQETGGFESASSVQYEHAKADWMATP